MFFYCYDFDWLMFKCVQIMCIIGENLDWGNNYGYLYCY